MLRSSGYCACERCTRILDNEGATIAFFFFVQVIVNAEAEVEPECTRTPLQHIAQSICKNKAEHILNLVWVFVILGALGQSWGELAEHVKKCAKI